MMVRVVIPYHLKMLANISGEVELDVASPVTLKAVLDAWKRDTRCFAVRFGTSQRASDGR